MRTLLLLFLLLLPSAVRADDAATYQATVGSTVWLWCFDRDWNVAFGSGVVIDAARGHVLTAYHCVAPHRMVLAHQPIRDSSGEVDADAGHYDDTAGQLPCKVIAEDPRRDLALLQLIKVPAGLKAVPLAASSARPGQSLFTIGNGDSSSALWRYAAGNVRQLHDDDTTFKSGQRRHCRIVTMTTPINGGDSGGPLLDAAGRLVGINSSTVEGQNQVSQAIDVAVIRAFLQEHARP